MKANTDVIEWDKKPPYNGFLIRKFENRIIESWGSNPKKTLIRRFFTFLRNKSK